MSQEKVVKEGPAKQIHKQKTTRVCNKGLESRTQGWTAERRRRENEAGR